MCGDLLRPAAEAEDFPPQRGEKGQLRPADASFRLHIFEGGN